MCCIIAKDSDSSRCFGLSLKIVHFFGLHPRCVGSVAYCPLTAAAFIPWNEDKNLVNKEECVLKKNTLLALGLAIFLLLSGFCPAFRFILQYFSVSFFPHCKHFFCLRMCLREVFCNYFTRGCHFVMRRKYRFQYQNLS